MVTTKERLIETPVSTPGRHRWRLLPRVVALRPRPLPAHRTLGLSAGLALVGTLLWLHVAGAPPVGRGTPGDILTWWQLAIVWVFASLAVFHVEINSEAHTFSLSEVPLVLGLFFAAPAEVLVARLVGEALVLVVFERQSLTKLVFNLALFVAETSAALAIFGWLTPVADPQSAQALAAAITAAFASTLLGAAAVWAVIRLHAAKVSARRLAHTSAVTAAGNSCLALVAAVLVVASPAALVPLAVLSAVVVVGYRGYSQLAKRYESLQLLHQFMAIISGPQRPDEMLRRVQREACRLLRAERSIMILYMESSDSPWLYQLTAGQEPADGGHDEPCVAELPEEITRLAESGSQTLLVPRTSGRPQDRRVLAALGAKDCIAAPLTTGGGVCGVMVLCDRLGGVSTFDAEDGTLCATLAAQAAIALENGRLIDRLQEQIEAREYEATHDPLTDLPNRALFRRMLGQVLPATQTHPVAVLLMDLDGFKEVNDTLGHQAGDDLLCQVARRLREIVGDVGSAAGMVARLGGDEFAMVLTDLPQGAETAMAVAGQIDRALRIPVSVSALTLEVRGSIGVALAPQDGQEPATLLRRADVAMYAAKRARAGVTRYDPAIDDNSELRLQLVGDLRAAILAGAIEVYFQPIARCADGKVVAAEALARWTHPTLGRVAPDEFVPVAERSGLIHDLTFYVLERVLAQVRSWEADGVRLNVSVNLSPAVLLELDWPQRVLQLLGQYRVSPHCLTLEITESGIMADPESTIPVLHDLVRSGVSFAIDDFGTGYSSLAYLQQLPVSMVKIDKSFVIAMNDDPVAASIVRSVIELGRSLDLSVVAEGVEDQRALDRLTDSRCHFLQGYYLSRPIPAAELTQWLRQRQAAAAKPASIPAQRTMP